MSRIFSASKEAFVELLFRRSVNIGEVQGVSDAPRDAYVLLRFADTAQGELPAAVFVISGDLREFFAFTTTYFPQLRPLTAYMRVYGTEAEFFSGAGLQDREVPPHYIAMILAERVMTRTPRDPAFREPDAVTQCASTFSYVACLARLSGFPVSSFEQLESRWASVEERYIKSAARGASSAVLGFWNLAELIDANDRIRVNGPMGDVLEGARSFVSSGKIDPFFWESLTRQLPEIREYTSRLPDVKERQVEPLSRAIQALVQAEHLDRTAREFLGGFLLAEFSNYSFDYLPTAVSMLRNLPLSVFWFAILASRASGNNLLEFSNGFGRYLRTRLSSDILAPPRADIAYHELALSEDLIVKNALRHVSEGELLVELFDGIVMRAPVGIPTKEIGIAAAPEDLGRLTDGLHALDRSTRAMIARLEMIMSRLDASGGDQLELVPAEAADSQARPVKRKGVPKKMR